MPPGIFLWPKSRDFRVSDLAAGKCGPESAEDLIRDTYPQAEPVLFSSARAGLTAVLQVLALSRRSAVWVPAYSSHCVLDAVGRICSPLPEGAAGLVPAAALVYHQWGFVSSVDFAAGTTIIEDMVDTLLAPAGSPFAVGGRFALWSLPKVLATLGGGVVFCRDREDAANLRQVRSGRSASIIQAVLRSQADRSTVASRYWNGAEAACGSPIRPMVRQITRALGNLNRLFEDRLRVIDSAFPALAAECAASGRVPSNVPVSVPANWDAIWGKGQIVSSGLRNFNVARRSPEGMWQQVAPLPVHCDVSEGQLADMISLCTREGGRRELEVV